MTKKTVSPLGCNRMYSDCENHMSQATGTGKGLGKLSLLLHSCCGPCSTSVIERLAEDFDITVFFYNPCITDYEEYVKRRESQIKFIREFNVNRCSGHKVDFLEGDYSPDEYLEIVSGYSNEPEGGKRCRICFEMRLEETAKTARAKGFGIFATTLTVSPHKNYDLIAGIGGQLAEKYDLEFLDMDFKKKAGFQRSIQLSKEHGLYRQDYCGCKYSKR